MTDEQRRLGAAEYNIICLQNQLEYLTSRNLWLTNIVSKLSQRIEVIENDAHIDTSQRNTVLCGMDEDDQRLVTNRTDDVTTSVQARSYSQTA